MSSIQIRLGAAGIKQAYAESLGQQALDIVCLSDKYERIIGKYFDDQFAPNVYGKIKTREILPDTSDNRKSAETKNSLVNAVRFLPRKTVSESDILLWSNRAIFVSFGATPMAIIITEQELVKSLKAQYEIVWESLQS